MAGSDQLELGRAEHLADEHERQQRRGAGPDILARGAVLDEQGQARAPEAVLVFLESGHASIPEGEADGAARLEEVMKPDIHPEYVPSHVRCTCGNEFWTRSTKPELHVEICSNCHPFYTGKQKLVDTGGRVERFRRRAARSRR